MTTRFRTLLTLFLGAAALAGSAPSALAQAPAAEHPAVKVVSDYLSMILTRQWKKGMDIVDEASMKTLKEDYVARIKQAPTIEAEEGMIRRVGKSTYEEVQAMSAQDWYFAFNDGLKERYKLEDETLAEIRKTIQLKTMSIAEDDGGNTVHILVKAIYSTGETKVERLDLTTVRNNAGKWQVVLDGQSPKITQLKPAAAPGGRPAPADPVKPAGKPAAKPAAKPAPVKPKRPA